MNKSKKKSTSQDLDPRQRIFDAAIKVFSEKGLQGARTREIAQAAGVNLAMLHYYYSSKEELYVRAVSPLLQEIFGRLNAAAESAEDPRARLEALIGVYFDFLKSHPFMPRLMMWELVTGARILKQILSDQLEEEKSDLFTGFRSIFLDGEASGIFRPVNPDQAVISTVALCIFPFIARDLIGAFRPDLMQQSGFLAERRQHILDLLLNGLAVSGSLESGSAQNSSEQKPKQITLAL